MSYLERENGGKVYYESYGSGSHALVLIHGWGMSCRTWDHVTPALAADGHRLVLIDHRGCGASDKDFADLSIDAIAGDVVALVDALGLESVVLNGWSLGGAVAVAAAAQLGGRCHGLVLTCGATPCYVQKPGFEAGGTEADMAATLAALTDDRVTFLQALAQGICAKDVGEAIPEWMWQVFLQASPLAGQSLGGLASLDQREMLAALEIPVLSFVGSDDAIVDPAICRWVGEHCSDAKVVEYAGVGHAPFIEEREAYIGELKSFLQRVSAS
jgi:pimeloyl-ACP methyl ester carboxylesterase